GAGVILAVKRDDVVLLDFKFKVHDGCGVEGRPACISRAPPATLPAGVSRLAGGWAGGVGGVGNQRGHAISNAPASRLPTGGRSCRWLLAGPLFIRPMCATVSDART